jgi:8-oxo-dGTP diphosphatase
VGVYSEPTRDSRGHTVSVAYALDVVGGTLTAGSDAAVVVLLDMEQLPAMAFDHAKIVADWKKG